MIPHELTHLVFDTAVRNPYHDPTHWLNEGLAVYLSQGYDQSDRTLVRNAANGGEIIPLPALGQFPTRPDKFSLAYAESVSAIDFMVRTYGRSALVKLIGSYAAGVTDEAAFTSALGVGVAAFSDAWLADTGAPRPVPYGPRPDPPGPLPAGWSATPAPAIPQPSAVPSLVGGPTTPPAPSARGPLATAAPAATAGAVAEQPAVRRTPDSDLAWLFGLLALALAAFGVGLLAFRRSHCPR